MAGLDWQEIVTTLGGNALLLAAAAWLIKTLISNRMALDLEKVKVDIKAYLQRMAATGRFEGEVSIDESPPVRGVCPFGTGRTL